MRDRPGGWLLDGPSGRSVSARSPLGRDRDKAIADVVEQFGELFERLEGKGRAVRCGIGIMGRVRELGTPEDCFRIAASLDGMIPVLGFAQVVILTRSGGPSAG